MPTCAGIIGRKEEKMNTIRLENLAGAFLYNNGAYLLLQRSPQKKADPNLWSYVGGHIEKEELNEPYKALIREIHEETGITEGLLSDLKLRYILIEKAGDIIYQNYIYFGNVKTEKFKDTDEGKLYWIKEEELLQRKYSTSFQKMLEHYLLHKNEQNALYIGVLSKHADNSTINWSQL
jgi:8-oxo-dGTP diphosphatase